MFLACTVRLAAAHADTFADELPPRSEATCDDDVVDDCVDDARDEPEARDDEASSVDDEGLATERLDDASADDPAPASIANAAFTPDWELGSDAREEALRSGTSWLGRCDVSITWRRAWSATTELVQRDELWLVGTWRL